MLKQLTKYKYSAAIVFFVVWMMFFDSNSLGFMYKQYNELKDLSIQEEFLEDEIAEMKEQKDHLLSSDDNLEKYAREKYFFKKADEDVFIFE